jgi:hypothetical protein
MFVMHRIEILGENIKGVAWYGARVWGWPADQPWQPLSVVAQLPTLFSEPLAVESYVMKNLTTMNLTTEGR